MARPRRAPASLLLWLAALGSLGQATLGCSSDDGASPASESSGGGSSGGNGSSTGGMGEPIGDGETFGDVHSGSFHLGPVDFAETEWHNSCAPYPDEMRALTGNYIAGLDNSFNGDGSLCDACVLITTDLGKSLLVHVVTTGVSKAPGDMDVSPEAYDFLYEADPNATPDNPRPMSWQLAKCPEQGNIWLQYQELANPWWTSLWVRNAVLPFEKVEVKSTNHADFFELRRETDGTLNDDGGFGEGPFELRFTAADGQVISQSFDSFSAGALVDSGVQFE